MRSSVVKAWLFSVFLAGAGVCSSWGQSSPLLGQVKIPLLAQAEIQPAAVDAPAPVAEVPVSAEVVSPAPAVVAPAASLVEEVVIPAAAPAQLIEEAAPAPAAVEAAPAAVEAAPAAVEAAPEVPAAEVAVPAQNAADSAEAAKLLAQQVEVRKQEQERKAKIALADAHAAFKRQNYGEASVLYKQALDSLPVRLENKADREQASKGLSESQYYVINSLVAQNRLQEALEMATLASKNDPENRKIERQVAQIQREIKDRQDEANQEKSLVERDPWKSPDVKAREKNVEKLIREGRGFLGAGDYKTAADRFMSALALEPENRTAMRYLEATGDKRFSSSTVERKATAENMTADVRDAWNPRDYVYVAPIERMQTNAPTESPRLLEKMETLIIPQIEFRQANIHDVVDFLVKASISEDTKTEDPRDKGVNIILNLGMTAPAAAAPASADPFAPASSAGTGASVSGIPEITFTARYISLLQAVKIITQVAGLKYRVEGKIVMIVPADAPDQDIEHKWYSVEPTFMSQIQSMGAPAEGAAAEGGAFGEVRATTGRGDVQNFFTKLGVEFPKGASVQYQQSIGRLIVANTSRNLSLIERILQEINVVPKQVEIEARFVEVNQTDLEELGFEWLLDDNWEVLTKDGGSGLPGGNERIQIAKNSGTAGFTQGLRFFGQQNADNIGPMTGGTIGSMMKIQSVLTNPEISLILHALERNGNADVLSAPKVTTRSGTEASIRVVTEYIYPTEFDIITPASATGSGTGTTIADPKMVAEPQNFETREVGVILSVVPEVSPEGNMINLNMRPEVVSEPVWKEYGVTLNDAQGRPYLVSMPQPFFQKRSVETQISIYDGATVVMGGLITEEVVTINDKVPFLGDLPIIGFLFRNRGSESQKRNLLIFVTARLVDPAGKPIRTQKMDESAPPPAVARQ
jgi:general secretion pathway protein D